MKSITLKESIEQLKFLKAEALAVTNDAIKVALENDVDLFQNEREKTVYMDGFIQGACWQKRRGDAKCLDLLEWIKERFVACCDEEATPCEWWWEIDADTSGKRYTTEEVFYEYDKNIKTF